MAVDRITGDDDNVTYEFTCDCGFRSFGWLVKADASAREEQHADEHETGEPMTEIKDFTREG